MVQVAAHRCTCNQDVKCSGVGSDRIPSRATVGTFKPLIAQTSTGYRCGKRYRLVDDRSSVQWRNAIADESDRVVNRNGHFLNALTAPRAADYIDHRFAFVRSETRPDSVDHEAGAKAVASGAAARVGRLLVYSSGRGPLFRGRIIQVARATHDRHRAHREHLEG